MKIDQATNDREFVRLRAGGKNYVLTGKYWLLDAGGVFLRNELFEGGYGRTVDIPDKGRYDDVQTDAVLVAIARRGMTGRNQKVGGAYVIDIPIPAYAEAVAELRSGFDKYGGEWSVPVVKAVPFKA